MRGDTSDQAQAVQLPDHAWEVVEIETVRVVYRVEAPTEAHVLDNRDQWIEQHRKRLYVEAPILLDQGRARR